MAQVELTRAAVEDLGRLIAVLTLPADTRERVRSCLQPLRGFPRLGIELTGRWQGLRMLIGPWRWMLLPPRTAELGRRDGGTCSEVGGVSGCCLEVMGRPGRLIEGVRSRCRRALVQ